MSSSQYQPSRFAVAASALGAGGLDFWFLHYPNEQSQRLTARLKLAAKLLGKTTGLGRSKALEAVAQAVRFPSWHALSSHLIVGETSPKDQLPSGWFDALGGSLVLMLQPEDEVALPKQQLQAFEQFGQTLAMLTDQSKQVVLDGVPAVLCGARSWAEVCTRTPLKARTPLYTFLLDEGVSTGVTAGQFDESPACTQLIEELDNVWQDYGAFTKPQQRKARAWVENALAAQPGFLEAGLALAWMQHDAKEPGAAATASRFIKQAEALMPPGYKGKVVWGSLTNRFYHRLLWLRMIQHHEIGDLVGACKLARRMLRLNPTDNLGVRFVLPLMQLELGDYVAASRAANRLLKDDAGLTASAIRAFCEFAGGNNALFRRELALCVFSLPFMRLFLSNIPGSLPEGDDGFRCVKPDMETFSTFAWPAYNAVPGLRAACLKMLAEPVVLQAEGELRRYWMAFWRKGTSAVGNWDGYNALSNRWLSVCERCATH